MRVLGFEKHWSKLDDPTFTTFRYPRRDRDWQVGEVVQVVVKPRSKTNKERLGNARILSIERYEMDSLTDSVARRDGFADADDMRQWLKKNYRFDDRWVFGEPMNKLTLERA